MRKIQHSKKKLSLILDMLSRYSPRTTQQTFIEETGRGWPHVALRASCVCTLHSSFSGAQGRELGVLSPQAPHCTEHRATPSEIRHSAGCTRRLALLPTAGPTNHLTSFISSHDIRSRAGIVPWATGPASCPFLRELHQILPQPHWAEAASWWFKFSYCFLSSG